MNYIRYTDTCLYYSMLAHGISEETAYGAAEITLRTEANIDTAIAFHHGVFHHLALVEVAEGEPAQWLDLFSKDPTQPRYPSVWVVHRWAKSPQEMDVKIEGE